MALVFFCLFCVLVPYVIGQAIYIFIRSFVLLSFFFSFLALSQQLEIGCLPYFHTWCGLSANLGCRSETCCTWLAGNAGCKKSLKIAIWAPSHNLSGYIFTTKARIDNRKKNLLSSNMSTTCPHDMVNFGPLALRSIR